MDADAVVRVVRRVAVRRREERRRVGIFVGFGTSYLLDGMSCGSVEIRGGQVFRALGTLKQMKPADTEASFE